MEPLFQVFGALSEVYCDDLFWLVCTSCTQRRGAFAGDSLSPARIEDSSRKHVVLLWRDHRNYFHNRKSHAVEVHFLSKYLHSPNSLSQYECSFLFDFANFLCY